MKQSIIDFSGAETGRLTITIGDVTLTQTHSPNLSEEILGALNAYFEHHLDQVRDELKTFMKALRGYGDAYSPLLEQLTEEYHVSCCEMIKARLCERYESKGKIDRLFYPEDPLYFEDQAYINLAIIKDEDNRASEARLKEKGLHRDQLLENYESIHQPKQAIKLETLFKDTGSRLLVQGRAGIGKSTLCRYIAYAWSRGSLWRDRFDWVFWVPLRALKADWQFKEVLNYVCLEAGIGNKLTRDERKALKTALRKTQTLWLLDGYDELSPEVKASNLWRELSQARHLLIASRPYAGFSGKVDATLEVLGFVDKDIPRYIEHFAAHLPEGQRLEPKGFLAYLRQNRNLWSIAHVPIQLELLCSARTADGLAPDPETMTMTELYTQMIERLFKNYLQKGAQSEDVREEIQYLDFASLCAICGQEIQVLSKLAFEGMLNEAIFFDQKALRKSLGALQEPKGYLKTLDYPDQDLVERLDKKSVGLHTLTKTLGLLKKCASGEVYFLHLSFQEYFAAWYVAEQFNQAEGPEEKWVEWLIWHKYEPRYRMMMSFIAGQLSGAALEMYLSLLMDRSNDLIGFQETLMWLDCWAEISQASDCLEERQTRVNTLLEDWLRYLFNHEKVSVLERFIARADRSLIFQPLLSDVLLALEYDLYLESGVLSGNLTQMSVQDVKVKANLSKQLGILKVLGSLTHPSERIVQVLCERAGSQEEDRQVRNAAVRALGYLAKYSEAAIIALCERASAQEKDEWVRFTAVKALGCLAEPREKIITVLCERASVEEKNFLVRKAAVEVLGSLAYSEEAMRALCKLARAKRNNGKLCEIALGALGRLTEPDKEAITVLCERASVQEKNDGVVWTAMETLANLAQRNEVAMGALCERAKSQEKEVRWAAVETLGHLSAGSEEVIAVLCERVQEKDEAFRQMAVEILGCLVGVNKAAMSALCARAGTQEGNEGVCLAAVKALGGLSAPSEEVIAVLCERAGVQEKNEEMRWVAVRALGCLAEHSEAAMTALCEQADVQEKYEGLCWEAVKALGGLSAPSEEVIAVLCERAGSQEKDEDVRRVAVEILGKLSAPSEEVIALLCERAGAQEKDRDVRWAAVEALGQLPAPSKKVVAVLCKRAGVQEKDPKVRRVAIEALSLLSAPSEEVITVLCERAGVQEKDRKVRQAAVEALGDVKKPNEQSIAVLCELAGIQEKDAYVRRTAVEALGWLPEPRKDVIDVLCKRTGVKEKDKVLRQMAVEALGRLSAFREEVIVVLCERAGAQEKDGFVRRAAIEALECLLKSILSMIKDFCQSTAREPQKVSGICSEEALEALPSLIFIKLFSSIQDDLHTDLILQEWGNKHNLMVQVSETNHLLKIYYDFESYEISAGVKDLVCLFKAVIQAHQFPGYERFLEDPLFVIDNNNSEEPALNSLESNVLEEDPQDEITDATGKNPYSFFEHSNESNEFYDPRSCPLL